MKKIKKPVLKRVRFTFEALCHLDANTDEMDLREVLAECHSGEMSGRSLGHETKLLNLQQACKACSEHGSDAEFCDLAAFEDGQRVWWTDPDQGLSSGWWTIVEYDGGGIYNMKNKAGGECQACYHELSEHAPKRGKK
jgi:hypothetical protein